MSNLTQRLLTAALGIPVVALLTFLGGYWFVFMVALLVAGAQYEFYAIHSPRLSKRHFVCGLLIGLILVVQQAVTVDLLPLCLILLIGIFVFDTLDTRLENGWDELAWMMIGIFYPAVLFSFAVNLRNNWGEYLTDLESILLLGGLLVIVWVTDSMAYFTGRAIGKTPLAPNISPKKTWEGTLGGFAGAVLFAVALKLFLLPFLSWTNILVCALIGGIGGQVGDLVESRLKRSFGIKDSGNILPGHGGVLDRIDGLIFAFPLYYFYLSRFGAFLV